MTPPPSHRLQGKLGDELRRRLAVRTVGDLRAVPHHDLAHVCGAARARTLQQLCDGEETSPVQDKGDICLWPI